MKKTLDTDDQLLADAKALAAQMRISLTQLIEEGLHLRLRNQPAAGRRGKATLPILKESGGLVAEVDGLSNKALRDALDDAPSDVPSAASS